MRGSFREPGAVCLHCEYRPARLHRQYPHLATNWCSDRCRIAAHHQVENGRIADLANEIRELVGLPAGRGSKFTLPELEVMRRRLGRALPAGPLARYPVTQRRRRKKATDA